MIDTLHIEALHDALCDRKGSIRTIAEQIEQVRRDGQLLLVAGNGGSASTASHLALDLFKNAKPPTNAVALTDPAMMSAFGNDHGYEYVWSTQIELWADAGNVGALLVISASGLSDNIYYALQEAKKHDIATLGLYGFEGGIAASRTDFSVIIPSADYGVIEDAHMVIGHILTKMIDYGNG